MCSRTLSSQANMQLCNMHGVHTRLPVMHWHHIAARHSMRSAVAGVRSVVACSCIEPRHATRAAVLGDLERLEQIEQLCCQQAGTVWSMAQLQEELERPFSHVLVITQPGDDSTVGFTIGWLLADELQVLHLAVDPAHQGRGLGMALVQELLQLSGCDADAEATLEVRASNEPALKLYSKLGFQEVGRRRRYYADGSDAVLMTRPPGSLCTNDTSQSS